MLMFVTRLAFTKFAGKLHVVQEQLYYSCALASKVE